jgi:hypothetical protein
MMDQSFKESHMKAPAGHYRKLLTNPTVRIAFTHTPVRNCTVIDNSATIKELQQSKDEYAQYYINGLLDGSMVTITENSNDNKVFAPGELYFKS